MTLRCCICHRNFSPVVPRPYPEFPGYCDECAELEEETRPGNPLEDKISNLQISASLFFPVTECDPRPWETLRAEVKRPRWASSKLCVHRVQEGDPYIATSRDGQDFIDCESSDGARLFKCLTFEDLSLDAEFVLKITA